MFIIRTVMDFDCRRKDIRSGMSPYFLIAFILTLHSLLSD